METSSICFPELLVPLETISIKESHVRAFYVQSNRFPEMQYFLTEGLHLISLESEESVHADPV